MSATGSTGQSPAPGRFYPSSALLLRWQRGGRAHLRDRLAPAPPTRHRLDGRFLGVLLGTFMGGMCVGSLPSHASSRPRCIRCGSTRAIEGGIGVIGIMVLFVLPPAAIFTCVIGGHGLPGVLPRCCARRACCPTILIGRDAAVRRALGRDQPKGVSWLGILYTAISPGPCSAACSAASTSCGSTTWPPQPTSPSRSTRPWPRPPLLASVAPYARGRGRRPQPRPAPPAILGRYLAIASLGPDGARRRGRLDAAALAAAGRYRLHLLHRSGGVPDRLGIGSSAGHPRARRDRSRWRLAASGSSPRPSPGRHSTSKSAPYWPIVPVGSIPGHLPARPGAVPLGSPAAGLPVGRELSAGARGRAPGREDPGGWSVAFMRRTRSVRLRAPVA